MYESTTDIFYNLYSRLSIGGFVIVDDWTILVCRKAVEEFRVRHSINEKVIEIDGSGAYWRKDVDVKIDIVWYFAFNESRSTVSDVHLPRPATTNPATVRAMRVIEARRGSARVLHARTRARAARRACACTRRAPLHTAAR
jgi:hypothetical protein